jgi:hydroxymethylpyrimidine pyrophosphatase-like HAD family hydrolase
MIAEGRVYTLAVDLDGTLAKKGRQHTEEILDPHPDAKEVMDEVNSLKVTIIINTVRGDKKQIKSWFEKHEIPYHHINHNPDQPDDSSDKIIADEYWDDRAVGWPGLKKALVRLKRKLKA